MGIYLSNMKMPTNCFRCDLRNGTWCHAARKWLADFDSSEEMKTKKSEICPIVPIPEHGRLGDLDALAEYVCQQNDWLSETAIHTFCGILRKTPTIIPAEPLNEEVNEQW